MRAFAAVIAALAVALSAAAEAGDPIAYLQSRQNADGGFAEAGRGSDPALTAWAALGLRAADARPGPRAIDYLLGQEADLRSLTDVELVLLAEQALGKPSPRLVARLRASQRANGAFGPSLNSTIWAVLALRAVGERVRRATGRYLLSHQTRAGGWSWTVDVAPDSNDTAAAIQALRAVGVRGAPIRRGLRYLRRLQNGDGGFELTPGRGSDTQSTAWAIQAYLASGARPGVKAFAYLARMRRPDGSFRYSARYVATPVWVTSQALPALARKPFPLR